MKRTVPIIFVIFMLLLSACKVKDYTPEIPLAFENNAKVTSGDFSYDCRICKNEDSVMVTVDSTAAKGMSMSYNGKDISFSFADFSYDIDGKNFEKRNAAIVIYEVFDYINSTEQLNAKKIDGGFKYEGRISLGDFILIQNEDNSFKTLTMRNMDYKIEFAA